MHKDIIFPYKQYVERALSGGTFLAITLAEAKSIASTATMPCVIKLLAEFDGEKRGALLSFADGAADEGIWVICGEAPFFELDNLIASVKS